MLWHWKSLFSGVLTLKGDAKSRQEQVMTKIILFNRGDLEMHYFQLKWYWNSSFEVEVMLKMFVFVELMAKVVTFGRGDAESLKVVVFSQSDAKSLDFQLNWY